jgi:hypothetical protein
MVFIAWNTRFPINSAQPTIMMTLIISRVIGTFASKYAKSMFNRLNNAPAKYSTILAIISYSHWTSPLKMKFKIKSPPLLFVAIMVIIVVSNVTIMVFSE